MTSELQEDEFESTVIGKRLDSGWCSSEIEQQWLIDKIGQTHTTGWTNLVNEPLLLDFRTTSTWIQSFGFRLNHIFRLSHYLLQYIYIYMLMFTLLVQKLHRLYVQYLCHAIDYCYYKSLVMMGVLLLYSPPPMM